MTLDQRISDFLKKLKAKDLILNEWYNYNTKVFTFNIWSSSSKRSNYEKDCMYTAKNISRHKAFNELMSDFNKEQS